MWALAALSISNARRTAIDHARTEAANLSAAFAEQIHRNLDDIAEDMTAVAGLIVKQGGKINVYKIRDEIRLISPDTFAVSFIAPDGRLASTTLDPHPEPVDMSDREQFRVHLDSTFKGIFIGKPATGRLTSQILIPITMRIEAKDGRFLGVLFFGIMPTTLTTLHKSVDLGPNGFIGLVGLDNVIRARFSADSPDGLEGIGEIVTLHPTPMEIAGEDEGFIVRKSMVDHVQHLMSTRRIPGYPLVVTVALDFDQVMVAANSDAKILLGLVGLATLLLAGLVIYLMREIDRRTAKEIALDAANIGLRASKEHAEQVKTLLTDAVECISEAFVIHDKDDRLVLCNDAYRRISPQNETQPGTSYKEWLRRGLARGEFKNAIGCEEQWLAKSIRDHQQASLMSEQPLSDGRHLLITDNRMKSGGTAGLRIDITNLVRTREALEIALIKAEAVNQAKALFLANMSHELRTPLNAIIGFSQIIKDQMLGPAGVPAYAEYAKDIHDTGDHLLELINNVLDASRIEIGKFDIKEETVELGELVQSAMQTVRVQAGKKLIALEIRLPEQSVGLRADTLRLRQILINLLANAVKFTPEGGRVTLSFEASPAAAIFTVADTGIGMSPDEIAVAIEPFQQIENAMVKRHEGVGLGLSLAKHMTEMHGGTLEIESEKGAGTTVRVVLPAERILHTPKTFAAA